MPLLFFCLTLFLLSLLLTGVFRHYALKKGLLDLPNHRSLHVVPTPRGGGIVFSGLFLLALCVAHGMSMIPPYFITVFALPSLMIVMLGYADDRWGLSVQLRLLIQLAATTIFLYEMRQEWHEVSVLAALFMAITMIWSTNLYNFMDGLDGLSSIEALTVYGVGGWLLWLQGAGAYSLVMVTAFLVAGVSGFLCWNFPKAKIFMGDVGSLFLGFLIVPVAFISHEQYHLSFGIWILLYLFFLMDTLLTLIRRLLKGDVWYEAHRLHAYQRLHQAGYTHRCVLGIAIGLNVIFSVLAILSVKQHLPLNIALLIAIFCYLIFYFFAEYKKPMYRVDESSC